MRNLICAVISITADRSILWFDIATWQWTWRAETCSKNYYVIISLICHNSVTTQNLWFCRRDFLKVLNCYNFLWVQRRHNCSPAASFANCVMTLYLLKLHVQTFLSTPITQKCQIFICDTPSPYRQADTFFLSFFSLFINVFSLFTYSFCTRNWVIRGMMQRSLNQHTLTQFLQLL